MSVEKVAVKYKTSDGREFTEESDANFHQEYLDIVEEFDVISSKLTNIVAKKVKTADGQPFKFGGFSKYYTVMNKYAHPYIFEFYTPSTRWSYNLDERMEWISVKMTVNGTQYNIEVGNMYADKKEAMKALVEARKQLIKQYEDDNTKLEEEIKNGR